MAAALLGDPQFLVLDEPINGLDPQGIRWMRTLLRERAASGQTVLLSSHVLTEAAQTVDDVVVIHHGRLVRQGSIVELERLGRRGVRVSTPAPERLATAVRRAGGHAQGRPQLLQDVRAPLVALDRALEVEELALGAAQPGEQRVLVGGVAALGGGR